jgi:two-component system KDP operon response regulator KdpE
MTKPSVLIIDDEPQIRKLLEINLNAQDYITRQASSGEEGLRLAASYQPDVILLDLGLPDMPGQEVLKQLREWYTKAIIIVSVQSSEDDIITGLDNGANDFLSKPFRVGELMARLRSALRTNASGSDPLIQLGDLEVDLAGRTVKLAGEVLKFTTTEYSLMALLARNAGKVLTHQYLLKDVWGVGFQTETQYLRVFIAQLRKKIEKDPNHPQRLITVSGVGYRLESL